MKVQDTTVSLILATPIGLLSYNSFKTALISQSNLTNNIGYTNSYHIIPDQIISH